MTVTYHPNGLPDSLDKRPCYHAVNPFPVGHLDAEVIYPVRNGDQLGAILLAFQKHQDWINGACERGKLPACMKTRSNASICSIVSGLRVSAQEVKLEGGVDSGNFFPAFNLSLTGKSGKFRKGAYRVFYPSRLGYQGAWEAAVTCYVTDRQLSPEVKQLLLDLIPDKSIFTAYLANLRDITDPFDLKVFISRLYDDDGLKIRDPKAHREPHIITSGLRGRINRISPHCVTLSFVARTNSDSFRQAAIRKYGYEGAYHHAVNTYMEIHRDVATEEDREWLLASMPDKTAFSEYLIPMALRRGSITKGESLKLLTDLEVS